MAGVWPTLHNDEVVHGSREKVRCLVQAAVAVGSVVLASCASGSTAALPQTTPSPTTGAPAVAVTSAVPAASESSLVDAIAAALPSSQEGAVTFAPSEAKCLADRVVADIGAARLVTLGADSGDDLTSLAWTAAEREVVFAAITGCIDMHAQLSALFADSFNGDTHLADCVATAYEKSGVLAEAIFETSPDPALDHRIDATINDAVASCS